MRFSYKTNSQFLVHIITYVTWKRKHVRRNGSMYAETESCGSVKSTFLKKIRKQVHVGNVYPNIDINK